MDQRTWLKIKSILKFALENQHSAFYRDKYRPFNLDKPEAFKSPDDFFKIPPLDKEELLRTPLYERAFAALKDIAWVASTSGTSGREPLMVFKSLAPGKNIFDFGAVDTIMSNLRTALVLGQPSRVPLGLAAFSGKMPAFFGNPYKMEETAAIAAELKIEVINTTPDLLLKFMEFLKPEYGLKNIRLLQFYGAPLSPIHREKFHSEFPNALLRQAYSSAEASGIGFQCLPLAQGELPIFHIYDDELFCEIIPEDGNGAGEIMLTHLNPCPSPLIRYKTGDLGEFIKKLCPCGLGSPLIEVLGRKNSDRIKIGGFEIHRESFERAVKKLTPYIEEGFEAHFYQKNDAGKIINEIVVKLTPKNGIELTAPLATLVEETFNNCFRISNQFSFQELVAQGLFLPIKIEFLKKSQKEAGGKSAISKKLVPHF